MAVVGAGAIPVIAEINETLTIDPIDIEKKITPRTKAIIPVHIQGFPCDMDAINAIAKKYNLFVLEDACQADGGSYKGKRLGTCGNAGAFSFNYFKVISTGEGGALVTNDREIFENSLIYHDSSAVAFFGNQLSGVDEVLFCGNEYRTNEISSAILRRQMKRLDGILSDLGKNKRLLKEKLADVCKFIPSNDEDGDCATTLALSFDTVEETVSFARNAAEITVPINTGKHVYSNWTPIMEKIGAFNPLMDPFKMEANRDIIPDYREDMCPFTLDLLSKVVYIGVNPDWTKERMDEKIAAIRNALK
jgi:dTDP-4-amino-4,6-dideoxygalactose transaminase